MCQGCKTFGGAGCCYASWAPVKRWEEKFTEDELNTTGSHMALGLRSEKERVWGRSLETQEFWGTVQWVVGWPAPPRGPVFPLTLARRSREA